MNNGFLVIDADRHVMEPSDLWDRYLEPAFKGRVRITGPFQSRRYVDGRSDSDSDQLLRDRTYDTEAMSAALFTEDPCTGQSSATRLPTALIRPRICVTWTARASMSRSCFPPSASTSSGTMRSNRESRPLFAAPTTTGSPSIAAMTALGSRAWRSFRCTTRGSQW